MLPPSGSLDIAHWVSSRNVTKIFFAALPKFIGSHAPENHLSNLYLISIVRCGKSNNRSVSDKASANPLQASHLYNLNI
jgi:hypothetical protein